MDHRKGWGQEDLLPILASSNEVPNREGDGENKKRDEFGFA